MPKRNFEYLLRQFKTKYDKNKDGKISSDEWHTWVTGHLILLCYKQSWDFRNQVSEENEVLSLSRAQLVFFQRLFIKNTRFLVNPNFVCGKVKLIHL